MTYDNMLKRMEIIKKRFFYNIYLVYCPEDFNTRAIIVIIFKLFKEKQNRKFIFTTNHNMIQNINLSQFT